MPRRTPEAVQAMSERAWDMKRRWYALHNECWLYAAPGMNPFRGGDEPEQRVETQGQPQHDHLFDSTLSRSAERLANRMTSELFPAGHDWAKLRVGPFFGAGLDASDDERDETLDDASEIMFAAIHASNCALALNMMAFDGVVSGTGLLKGGISADSATLLDFEAVDQSEVALMRGAGDKVWGFFRKMRLPMEFIRVYWPNARKLPVDETEARGSTAPPRRWDVNEAIYYDPVSGVWYEDVLLKGDGVPVRIFERDRLVCPWIPWRYALMSGEVQGRSPVMSALPDTRTLNHAKYVRLESASMRVAGMFTFREDGVFNPHMARLGSGAFLQVGSNSTDDPTIRPLEVSGDVQLGELITDDTMQAVKETMLDFALPDNAQGAKTATEIAAKQSEARLARGQPYLRMVEEVGRPLLRLSAYLLQEAGQLPGLSAFQPALPDGRPRPMMLDGTDVAVQFTAPSVQIQDIIDAQTEVEWAVMSQQAAGPEAWQMGARTEDIPESLGMKLGVDPALMRPQAERDQMRRQQQEAMMGQGAPGGAPPQQEMMV